MTQKMRYTFFVCLSVASSHCTYTIQEQSDTITKNEYHYHIGAKSKHVLQAAAAGTLLVIGFRYGRPTTKHIRSFITLPSTIRDVQTNLKEIRTYIRNIATKMVTKHDLAQTDKKLCNIAQHMATKQDITELKAMLLELQNNTQIKNNNSWPY